MRRRNDEYRPVEQRRICIVTGSRAEYGLLQGLMEEIRNDPALRLQVVVTGAHLSPRFGETWREIIRDGFAIDERVDIDLGDDSPLATARSLGRAVACLAEAMERLMPHIVVLLGDRYEIFAAASAAMMLRRPIAHIHGGEITEGALDDAMRHAITKMAYWHFTAAEEYRRRVIQLGEAPERVFNTGAMGMDAIARTELLDRTTLADRIGIAAERPYFVVTFHPVTLATDPAAGAKAMCAALAEFPDHDVIVTGVNADPGHDLVARILTEFAQGNRERVRITPSLGRVNYLSAVKHAAAVVGNSSSGILEAPALGTPTVNIGDRQRGRVRAASVIDCGEDREMIAAGLRRALEPAWREHAASAPYPFGAPGAARRIAALLKSLHPVTAVQKKFHDLSE